MDYQTTQEDAREGKSTGIVQSRHCQPRTVDGCARKTSDNRRQGWVTLQTKMSSKTEEDKTTQTTTYLREDTDTSKVTN